PSSEFRVLSTAYRVRPVSLFSYLPSPFSRLPSPAFSPLPRQPLQRLLDQLRRVGGAVVGQRVAYRALGLRGRITEPREGGQRLLAWPHRSGRQLAPDLLEPVVQLQHQSFRLLLPDAAHGAESRDVFLPDTPHGAIGPQGRQQSQRQPGAEATRGKQSLKDEAFRRAIEAEQRPAVLLHHQLGVELHLGAECRQSLHDTERESDAVADSARGLDQDGVAIPRAKDSGNQRDHPRRPRKGAMLFGAVRSRWVSAMATPSAASAGRGALFNRSSCATMKPT